jgi:hypothetical protein
VAETNEQRLIGALFKRILNFTQFGGVVERAAIEGALQGIQSFEAASEEMIQTEIAACEGNDGSVAAGDAPAACVPQ